jgi:hypothetical protein
VKLRHLIPFAAIGAVGGAGFYVYSILAAKDRQIEEQKRVIGELGEKLDRAWASDLVADLRVDGVEGGALKLTFIQYQPGTEKPIFRKDFTLPGEEVYVDALVVSFDRALVEGGDGLRGKSLLLFRRAFGDKQQPVEGVPLTAAAAGDVPAIYSVDPNPSDFEKQIWADFWQLANDPTKAKERGVRVAQGEAPHVKAAAGQVYKLTLRASAGLEMTPRIPAAALPEKK